MTVGIRVGSIVSEIGAPGFLNAFFSTTAGLLESGQPGTRFPVVSHDLYAGCVDAGKVGQAIAELRVIHDELSKFPPDAIIWDIEDRSAMPPWGSAISAEITSMGDYFVSSTGRDFFELLMEIFQHALKHGRAVDIV
jgi:Immunity protein 70